jgi:hypothetical protein
LLALRVHPSAPGRFQIICCFDALAEPSRMCCRCSRTSLPRMSSANASPRTVCGVLSSMFKLRMSGQEVQQVRPVFSHERGKKGNVSRLSLEQHLGVLLVGQIVEPITLSMPPRIWDGVLVFCGCNRACHRVRATQGVRFCRLSMLPTDCVVDVRLCVLGQIFDSVTPSIPPRILWDGVLLFCGCCRTCHRVRAT